MDECEQFLGREYRGLLRAAWLLTGSRPAAEDLAQETAVRVVVQWPKVARADRPEAYARRVLLNTFLSARRRAWRAEVPVADVPDSAAAAGDGIEDLRRALLTLPPRQRAAVVLRHYEDRSEVETAALLGCSVGNVKALTSRGLAALRTSTHLDELGGVR